MMNSGTGLGIGGMRGTEGGVHSVFLQDIRKLKFFLYYMVMYTPLFFQIVNICQQNNRPIDICHINI